MLEPDEEKLLKCEPAMIIMHVERQTSKTERDMGHNKGNSHKFSIQI